jgi:hypothetical protein
MQSTKICKVVFKEISLLLSTKGFIDVAMLGEIGFFVGTEGLPINEGVVPLLWITSYTTLLSG